jgi:hypothetical protein
VFPNTAGVEAYKLSYSQQEVGISFITVDYVFRKNGRVIKAAYFHGVAADASADTAQNQAMDASMATMRFETFLPTPGPTDTLSPDATQTATRIPASAGQAVISGIVQVEYGPEPEAAVDLLGANGKQASTQTDSRGFFIFFVTPNVSYSLTIAFSPHSSYLKCNSFQVLDAPWTFTGLTTTDQGKLPQFKSNAFRVNPNFPVQVDFDMFCR